MTLTPAMMDLAIDEHFGFEAKDDVAGVLATLAEDVEHDILGWPEGPTRGRNAARLFYETMFQDLSEGEVTSLRRLYGGKFLIDESLWRGRAVGHPFGLEGRGRPLEFRLLHIIEFADDGLIARENVWFDFPAIQQQLPQD